MSKHTPGPWHYRTSDGSIGGIDSACGLSIAQAFQVKPISEDLTQETRKSNAHLIAAAPDLLDALKELLLAERLDDDDQILLSARVKARAAIAKAEGK